MDIIKKLENNNLNGKYSIFTLAFLAGITQKDLFLMREGKLKPTPEQIKELDKLLGQ